MKLDWGDFQLRFSVHRKVRMSRVVLLVILLLNLGGKGFCADEYSRKDFPPGFVFGAGTSAYQVEGAANEDGRSPSIWDTFAHEGNVRGATGDIALDQYHKYKEDVQLMAETGLEAYRFSISWSRLIPNGRGPVNPKGLQYYNNLINELTRNGIQPHVLLYNYDHPQVLEDEYGGWVSRKMVKDFTDYADVCFREFGDRVSYWTTINEPNIFAVGGYDQGITPPRRCSAPFSFIPCSRGNSSSEPYLAAHHMLLAHASAARLYKKKYLVKQHGYIGLTLYAFWFKPVTNSTEDMVALERAKDFFYGWMMHPLVYGDYPSTMKKIVGSRLPTFTANEAKLVKNSFDFIGLIHYSSVFLKDNSITLLSENRDFNADIAVQISIDLYATEFAVEPSGLQGVIRHFKQAYGNPPIFVYENGQRNTRNSSLEDTSRVKYLHAYIGGLLDEISNGADVRGYFVWSFLDVFELLDGFESGYGLYYVDLNDPDLKRYPKLSAHWYSRFLRGGNVSSDGIIELAGKFSKSSS